MTAGEKLLTNSYLSNVFYCIVLYLSNVSVAQLINTS